ncbi:MAG: 2-hydroxyacyl-CoA dehydratase family protein [Pseudomonadota bacterium]
MNHDLWFKAVKNLEDITDHVLPKVKSSGEKAYYELYTSYFQKVTEAMRSGKEIAAHSTFVPPEIFHAMDMVPVLIVSSSGAMTVCTRNYKEAMDTSRGYGVPLETCSAHRIQLGHFVENWFPKPKLIVHMGAGCDAFASSGGVSADMYGLPDFFIDVPWENSERGVKYLANEFGRLIEFVEKVTGRKMDWDRLKENMAMTAEMTRLYIEIAELRKAIPSPMESRRAWQSYWMYWINAGTPEGVKWFTIVRDEVKARVEKGIGAIPNEKLRLLDLFMPPQFSFKLQDWLAKDYGALFVNESIVFQWGKDELDPSDPLEALAKRYFNAPMTRCIMGSSKDFINDSIKVVKDYKIDGAVFWAQNACRQSGIIRSLKDALSEQAGIPTLVVDCDIMDPTFVTVEEMQVKLKEFIEILSDRVGQRSN